MCGSNRYTVLYKENFNIDEINERTFSARRLPDRIHYQMVVCKKCGMTYSNPILEPEKIEKLYRQSFTDYDAHVENLRITYGAYIRRLEDFGVKKGKFLDIGCGTGFMLEEALDQGYKEVWGVEPGKKSVQKAPKHIQKNIIVDVFRPGIFKRNYFDVITCFQTFDHIIEPNELLAECFKILKKGGMVLFFNHDIQALPNRILGEASPIIDIEHTYLFNKKTMKKIFTKHGFKVLAVESAYNVHNVAHWALLAPVPKFFKLPLRVALKFFRLAGIRVKMYLGNFVLYAKK